MACRELRDFLTLNFSKLIKNLGLKSLLPHFPFGSGCALCEHETKAMPLNSE